MVLADCQIRDLAHGGMITPFAEGEKRPGVISFGLSSFGYDMRLGNKFKVCREYTAETYGRFIDPKDFDSLVMVDQEADSLLVPAHGFVLGESLEMFHIPDDVLAICMGKSTFARCGLVLNTTPLEPGWRGKITLELSNTANLPIRVYAGEGIGQVLFLRGEQKCEKTYASKPGSKYQDQAGIVLPYVH